MSRRDWNNWTRRQEIGVPPHRIDLSNLAPHPALRQKLLGKPRTEQRENGKIILTTIKKKDKPQAPVDL